MSWAWDDDKNHDNIRKHGIRFESAQHVLEDPLQATEDDPNEQEQRFRTTGMLGNMVIVVFIPSPQARTQRPGSAGASLAQEKPLQAKDGDMNNLDKLTPSQVKELETLAALPDELIDTSDIPEIADEDRRQSVRGLLHMPPDEQRRAIDYLKFDRRKAPTNTSERALETRVCHILAGDNCERGAFPAAIRERPAAYSAGWVCGDAADYDAERCVDVAQLAAFLHATQPEIADALSIDADTPARNGFLRRLKLEIDRRGVVDVMRKGVKHNQHEVMLYYAMPSLGNDAAYERYEQNRFSITRQLRFGKGNRRESLDLALFVNGLPLITFELKNNLTKQTAEDAAQQYRRRDRHEPLFRVGRCLAHFAVDESEALFCTEIAGKQSAFLPFNKGYMGGAGNPVNPMGLKTDYLWHEIFDRYSMSGIIERYALLTESKDATTGRTTRRQIWPRYHQIDAIRMLTSNVQSNGAGKRYLVQHSAGSGKSNTIAWLTLDLVDLERDGAPAFRSVIVVTDRVLLDRQISETIRQFTQVSSTLAHAESAADLRRRLAEGVKVIITTVQKFPFIQDAIGGADLRDDNFAIVIDEAHSGQGGQAAAAMAQALGGAERAGEGNYDGEAEEDYEDRINRIIESRKMLPNASYFAFTATPKNKTLELFGSPREQPDGTVKHFPFHNYTMKQAIQERFIIDPLTHYTEVKSYYRLVKAVEDDPQFDARRAQRKLIRYVEGSDQAIRAKAEIMADHFLDSVIKPRKLGGHARAMVVTDGVARAIDYFFAINDRLRERGSPHRALVAFSGEREYAGKTVSEAALNGFPEAHTAAKLREDPNRILICADKFQTGYDEPLLQAMYVDKTLFGIRAVQTLSRLNRAHPGKADVFVLDFMNHSDAIAEAFSEYYRATILSDETDPNKLHDLKAALDDRQIYAPDDVRAVAKAYLDGEDRGAFEHRLDDCARRYRSDLDEDGQIEFKGNAKAFTRAYAFLSQLLPYGSVEWEELSIYLRFLIPKLPAPSADDFSIGIEDAVDMDSYRIEKQAVREILLADADAEIDPVPAGGGGHMPQPEMESLSTIIAEFNSLWGTLFTDTDKASQMLESVSDDAKSDAAFLNAARGKTDVENAKEQHARALKDAISAAINCSAEFYNAYSENADFRAWVNSRLFQDAYERANSTADTPD